MKKVKFLCLLLVLCLLPVSAMAGLRRGKIVRVTAQTSVNVREEADANSKLLGEAMSNNTYTLLRSEGDWYYIQFTSQIKGYVSAKYTQVEDGLVWYDFIAGEVEAVVRNTHYNAVNVRTESTKHSDVIGEIKPDSTWPYCGTENGWNRIRYNDQYGFVAANLTTIEEVDSSAPAADPFTLLPGGFSFDQPSGDIGNSLLFACSNCSGGVCSTCDGNGTVYSRKTGSSITCPSCEGDKTCWACGGDSLH